MSKIALPASRAEVIATMEKTILDKMGDTDKAKKLFAKWWDVAEANRNARVQQNLQHADKKRALERSDAGFKARADRIKELKGLLQKSHPDTCTNYVPSTFRFYTNKLKEVREKDLRVREEIASHA